ncbi:MAG: hypothetical protein MPL62_08245 [Alphaproteobacteria bacterium]|nr:hypothetical protein [Alphaproteobacteria bacterium]
MENEARHDFSVAFSGANFFSDGECFNQETDEVRPLALEGVNFRLLRQPLKRTAPTDARRRCLQKIKIKKKLT